MILEIGILVLILAAVLAVLSYVHDLAEIQRRAAREIRDLRLEIGALTQSLTREED